MARPDKPSFSPDPAELDIEPDDDGEVIVRVQPELLRTGRITIALLVERGAR